MREQRTRREETNKKKKREKRKKKGKGKKYVPNVECYLICNTRGTGIYHTSECARTFKVVKNSRDSGLADETGNLKRGRARNTGFSL